MLVGGVQGDGEDRARSPFESDFGGSLLPYRGSAPPFNDIDDLFEKMSLRQSFVARRDLTNIGVGLLLFGKIEIATRNAHPLPSSQLQFHNVADNVSPDDRNSFLGLELIVRGRSKVEMFRKGKSMFESPLRSPFLNTIILWRQPGRSMQRVILLLFYGHRRSVRTCSNFLLNASVASGFSRLEAVRANLARRSGFSKSSRSNRIMYSRATL